jgi:hypothetical protein
MNPPWRISRPKKQKMTVLEDGLMIDGKWVTELEEKLGEDWDVNILWPTRSSLERIHRMMIDTDVFIFANGETLKNGWSWMWLLPEGARVIEIQNEMDPQGDAIHFAGAAGLSHKLVVMRKGLRDYMIRDSVKHTVATCLGKGSVAAKTNTKPIVWLPRSDITGFYAHAGDSFREMVRIWEERGYCQVKEHPVATNCWWGEVGSGWLLYDRPNLDWIYNAPPVEQSWKYGLFGNPEPPNGGGGFAWSFWPRRPRPCVKEVRFFPYSMCTSFSSRTTQISDCVHRTRAVDQARKIPQLICIYSKLFHILICQNKAIGLEAFFVLAKAFCAKI